MAVTLVATTPKGFGLPQIDARNTLFEYGASSVHVLSGQVQLNGAGPIWQFSETWYGPNTGFCLNYYGGHNYISSGGPNGNFLSLVQLYVDPANLLGDGNTAAEVNSPTFRSTSEPCLQMRNADLVANPTTNFPAGSLGIALITIDPGGRMINLQDCRP